MLISAFFGIPFVALANKYRKADIDFTFLHAVDVANLSFSLWGSFAVSYFVVYCGNFVIMRIIPFIIGSRIDGRANKFLDSGVLKDPWSITRYIETTDRLKLEYSEAYQRLKLDYAANYAWALFLLWTGIWNLSFISFLWAAAICYGLFKFDDATRQLRDRMSWKPYRYRYAAELVGPREERIERYRVFLEERERRPKASWSRFIYNMLQDIPSMVSLKVEWNSNHGKVTAAVCILIVALHFGSALALAAEDGPDRVVRIANQEHCGKLLVQSYYGFHMSVGVDERIVFLPRVDAIEDLPLSASCEVDGGNGR